MADAAAIPKERKKWDLFDPHIVDRGVNNIIVRPVTGVASNAGSLLKVILIFLLIACVVYLSVPVFRNYGPTVLLGNLKLGGFALTAGLSHLYQQINCAMSQECVTPGPATDTTQYGVFISSVYTEQPKFRQWDDIVVKASPKAVLLKNMNLDSCASVSCSLEDGTLTSQSQDCIPLKDISKSRITCIFAPMVSNSTNMKQASVGLTYSFKAETSIPLSMVDAAEYNKLYNTYDLNSESPDETESKVASFYKEEKEPSSDPKLTPIVIGAKIDRNQPIPVGDPSTTLVINIQNKGDGYARIDDISVDLPPGVGITDSAELKLGAPTPIEVALDKWRSTFGKDNLQSLSEDMAPGDSRPYDFKLDTTGFQLDNVPNSATTRKIYITVDYTYKTTSKMYVTVATCDEIGGCKDTTTVAADGATSGGTV